MSGEGASWLAAEEVLGALGAAAVACQTYAHDHPRVVAATGKVAQVTAQFFEKHPDEAHLTYLLREGQLEFRGIPLGMASAPLERLFKAFQAKELGGLQLERGLEASDVILIVSRLGFIRTEKTGNATVRADEETIRNHCLASQEEVEKIHLRGESKTANLSGLDEAIFGGFSVFEGTARSLLTTYRTILSKPDELLGQNQRLLEETIDRVVDVFAPQKNKLATQATTEYFDDFTYHHSANVCTITVLAASSVVKDRELLRKISLAALLHDIGKSRVPEEILHKPGRLTPAEREVMESHPVHGAEILLSLQDVEPLAVSAAFGHHMVLGKGPYPQTRRPFRCNWVTRLISVVDIYEALTATRPYKKGMSAEAAFRIITSMPGLEENGALVRLLYDAVGPYPVGTLVELSTGERARVCSINPANPRLPRIELLTDPGRMKLPVPVPVDLAQQELKLLQVPRRILRAVVRQSADDQGLEREIEPEPNEILGAPVAANEAFISREG